MKLTVLTENVANGIFAAEHGLSYYIEYDNINILFDTGYSDIFLKNADKLNIDIDKTNIIVLSHGHWDHGNVLQYLKNKKLICHPDCFMKRYRKSGNSNIGLYLSYKELKEKFEILETRKPYKITENIIFLGEIPRITSFEAKTTTFIDENGNDDFIPDDSAIAIIKNEELIIIAGCSHSGICNIIEYAKTITGLSKVNAVIGGFHLKENDYQTKKTIKYLKTQKIKQLFPSHCTDFPALVAFYNEFEIKQVKTGMIFNF